MSHASKIHVVAVLVALATVFLAGNLLLAADRTSPAPANPSPQKSAATMEKLKDFGAHLGRALDIAVDLLSGNETDLLSKNKTALLSGNKPTVLSGNTTPILSGNTLSVFSNIKVEIHISNSGNRAAGGTTTPPAAPQLKR